MVAPTSPASRIGTTIWETEWTRGDLRLMVSGPTSCRLREDTAGYRIPAIYAGSL